MLISKLEWIDKKRCRVYIDERIAFVLYKGDLSHYDIEEQSEISEEKYNMILENLLLKRAKLRLLNLLKARDYTESQLRKKLREGFYPANVIEKAMTYVKGYGYVDDESYAYRYLECYGERKSVREMKQKLAEKGIEENVLKAAISRWEKEGTKQDEEKMVRRILEKRKFPNNYKNPGEKQKQIAYLCRKGYGMETINVVINEIIDNAKEEFLENLEEIGWER